MERIMNWQTNWKEVKYVKDNTLINSGVEMNLRASAGVGYIVRNDLTKRATGWKEFSVSAISIITNSFRKIL